MITSLRRKLDSKFNPERAGDVAVNNLEALSSLLNTGAVSATTKIQDSTETDFNAWNQKVSTDVLVPGFGIKTILGSLARLIPLLEDDMEMKIQIQDVLKAFNHMGFTVGD